MLDQLMRVSAQQGTQFYQLLQPLSENFGNFGTYGYKARRFELFLRPDGATDLVKRVDTSQGPLEITQRELDVAIKGPGYIPVSRPNGDIAYTRHGGFKRNEQGYLVTLHGDIVGAGIQIPAVYHKLEIAKNGTVSIIDKPGDEGRKIGEIPIVVFSNPEELKNIGDNLLAATPGSGSATKLEKHESVFQRQLERANIKIEASVAEILKLNTGVIANLRLVKFLDEIYREGVNLRQ
jgi:flagellar basal-body rod protein FlgG